MADSVTTHYAFVQPQVGASLNTWGTKLNNDFGSIDSILWAISAGISQGVNVESNAASITLTNPIVTVQKISFTAASQKLVFPAMNAATSAQVGARLLIINAGSNAFQIVAQDTTTNILTSLMPGSWAIVVVESNATSNGSFDVLVPLSGASVVPVTAGGTGTGTQFTQGSVVFAGASGIYSQDNAKFFWDDTNFRLGLGTATPTQQLQMTANALIGGTLGVTGVLTGTTINASTAIALNGTPVLDKINIQTFSSTGTYTPTSGTQYAIFELVGGGGGGGSITSNNQGCGGGGSGGYLKAMLTSAQIGASQVVTIGTGGASASNGSTTSVGTLLSATGGAAGATGSAIGSPGGAGGTPTVSTGSAIVLLSGQPGSWGATDFMTVGGGGGSSPFGAGAPIIFFGNNNSQFSGANGTGNGSGGSGAGSSSGGGSSANGGAGTAGYVVVTEFISV